MTIGSGNLVFAAGASRLGDTVVVNSGKGSVTNNAMVRVASPVTIVGNLTQSSTGVLDFQLGGAVSGGNGALTVTSLATLGGSLAIDLTGGFDLGAGDAFNLLTFGKDFGSFSRLSLDGVTCSSSGTLSWTCSNLGDGLYLTELITGTSLSLLVEQTPTASLAAFSFEEPAEAFIAPEEAFAAFNARVVSTPEPSTWALLVIGFLGLVGLRIRRPGVGAPRP